MNRPPDLLTRATDNELLMQFVKANDEACFEAIVSRHSSMVLHVCRTVLGNQADAEDAFQATFLVMLRKAKCLVSVRSLAAWLYKVAYRIAVRASQTRKKRQADVLHSNSVENEIKSDVDQFHRISQREVLSEVFAELSALPEKYKSVLIECYLQGRSYRDVAEGTDSTETAVKGRVAQAKRVLRRKLIQRGVALSFVLVLLEQIRGTTAAASLQSTTVASSLASFASQSMSGIPETVRTFSNYGASNMKVLVPANQSLVYASVILLATVIPLTWAMNRSVDGQEKNSLEIPATGSQDDPFGNPAIQAKTVRPSTTNQSDPFGSPAVQKKTVKDAPTDAAVSRETLTSSAKKSSPGEVIERKIESALSTPASFEFIEMPLNEVADQIAQQYDVPVFLDRKAIEDVGLSVEEPVTGEAGDRSLRTSLRFLFQEIDVTFVIKDETLVITTQDAIANSPEKYNVVRLYDLSVYSGEPDDLIAAIRANIDPNSWDGDGGNGSANLITIGGKSILSVSHTSEHQHKIKILLEQLHEFVEK